MKARPRRHPNKFNKLPLGCLLPCFTGLALVAAADQNTSEQDAFDRYFGINSTANNSDWTTHFSIGAVVGLNIKANFNETGLLGLGSTKPGTYDDGYVYNDQTGNSGYTSNWGYDNASQYNVAAQTLTFHGTSGYQVTGGGGSQSGGPFPGFDLDYGGSLYQWDNFRLGWDLGFDLMPMKITDDQTMSATVNQNTYVYNTLGNILPGPGYRGGSSGTGVIIPTTTESTSPGQTLAGTVSGSRSLDMMLYAVRLGPTFYWDFAPDFSASVGVGPALGVISAEYKYNEIITTANGSANSTGSFTGLDVVYGGDVNATLLYHTSDRGKPFDLYLTAQYMPLTSADFSQGGRDGRVDLSGQVYISAGVNWSF